jgi:phosphate transport system substrate-binding protein
MRWTQILAGVVLVMLVAPAAFAQPAKLDTSVREYQKTSEVISGDLNVVGSNTVNNLMILWAEDFQKYYPDSHILIESKGSYTATPALIAGTAQLGMLSRAMRSEESQEFEQKVGYKAMRVLVGFDALVLYVHKDNPLEQLTLQEADGIFSKTLKGGGKDIKTWGDLGLTGEWTDKPISLYSTHSLGATYSVFRDYVLLRGEYKDTVQELPGLASVVQGIGADRFAMGFSGIGYKTAEVKPLKLAKGPGEPYYSTSVEELLAGKYPLTRSFNLYCNKAPDKPLDPLLREFLRFELSKEGQEIVTKAGYTPIPGRMDTAQLNSLN